MLTVKNLEDYTAAAAAAITEIRTHEVAVTRADLMKFMEEHAESDNTLLLALIPSHDMKGPADAAKWDNTVGFYFLEKTDYSELGRSEYLAIFERTQAVARKFVHKLLTDKADNTGLFCGFLAYLSEDSISLDPVVGLHECNGYYLEISMESNA